MISISLAYRLGVLGVQIGTFFAYLPIAYGRIRFVIKNFFGQSMRKYLLKHLFLFGVVLVESFVLYLLTNGLAVDVLGIGIRFVIWLTVPPAINLLIYFRNPHFKDMCRYFRNLLGIVKNKVKKKKADEWRK